MERRYLVFDCELLRLIFFSGILGIVRNKILFGCKGGNKSTGRRGFNMGKSVK